MQRNRNADDAVHRMLRETLGKPLTSSDAGEACIDGETLAAWVERSLPAARAELVEAHLSRCARCQSLMATFARTVPMPEPRHSFWQHSRLRWLVPITAAATAVAIWIALPTDRGATPPAVSQEADAQLESQTQLPSTPPAASPDPRPLDASKNAATDRLGQVGGDANALARRSSEEATRPTGERTSAEREARVATGDQRTADGALAERIAVAPAAPPVAPGRSEAAAQAQTRAPIEIVSPSPDSRWRIVGTAIERSTTGGKVWEAAVTTSPTQVTAGSSPGPLVCWLVGPGGAVRLTTDGVQFRSVTFPERVDLVGVRATSATIAVVTAVDGRAFRTDDQGVTWAPVAP